MPEKNTNLTDRKGCGTSGYRLIGIDLLEEGPLPRKLFYVTLRKNLKKIDI